MTIEIGQTLDGMPAKRCMNCQIVGMTDADSCPVCGASGDYEFGEIENESGISDEAKLYWTEQALKKGKI